MVKTCKSVIAWKIHGSVPFRLVCILFFASVAYEIIDLWRAVPGFQQLISNLYSFEINNMEEITSNKNFVVHSHPFSP